jgi:hypothetical protein
MRYITIILLILSLSCKRKDPVLFKQIPSSASGITFNNAIQENEMLNMINYQYLYNGGGVGIGDFNNDSLPDIYFTASLQSNKLYINRGNMKFEDVTTTAGVGGEKKWCRGVSVVDINNDGLLDMYIAAAAWQSPELKKDILYVNQGVDPANGIPRFREMAQEYGLVDTVSTHMSAFFDYDNDGDLDLYVVVNDLNDEFPSTFRKIRNDGSGFTNDILYRNNWNEQLQHPVFTNVTKEAGITWEGNGLGLSILDINQDGWKDIYVSNDYLSGNLLYINNKNGTFTNKNEAYFKHGSLNAMGNDAGDINNDGLLDIVEMDMMPEDNYRQKMMMNPVDYNWYVYSEKYGFPYQTVRNTLQLNQGSAVLENDSVSHPVFSDIAYAAGVAHTDWSWAALLTDVDNDGYKDLMTTNGLPKDVTDIDFIAYREQGSASSLFNLMQKLPPVHISNYIYRNNRDLSFSDKTKEWGWDFPTYSAGIGYADFDRDGDMDVVINNTNMEASLLENQRNQFKQPNNYIRFVPRGGASNIQGIGTMIKIYYNNQIQVAEHTPYHGYMSSMEPMIHFGLDTFTSIDSVVIIWPDFKKEKITGLAINETHHISRSANALPYTPGMPSIQSSAWFTNRSTDAGINLIHDETDYPDFNFQRQLPHKLSQFGPVVAQGDFNGDELTDIVVGGSAPNPAFIYRQTSDHKFVPQKLISSDFIQTTDDGAICIFDADNDQDKDILITTSAFNLPDNNRPPKDRLYINDSKGNFSADTSSTPYIPFSKTTAKAMDYDKDGDEDLFIGERGIPGQYPKPVSGYILRNDSKSGVIKFTDVTSSVAPGLKEIGLITDMLWSDFDNDKDMDMIITGEWMGIHFFVNDKAKFNEIKTSLQSMKGWWNCLAAADMDGDGDMDYAAGNYGTNGIYQVNEKNHVSANAGDLDGNKRWDLIMGMWKPETLHGNKKEYPVAYRDQIAEEIPSIKKQFDIYSKFAKTDITGLLNVFSNKPTVQLKANEFRSGWIENKGKNEFAFHPFPVQAQWAPVNAIIINDFNHDKQTDILLAGNDYCMHPYIGRYDASNGLLLKGSSSKSFTHLSIAESGIFIPGNARSMIAITYQERQAIIVTQNKSRMQLYVSRKK